MDNKKLQTFIDEHIIFYETPLRGIEHQPKLKPNINECELKCGEQLIDRQSFNITINYTPFYYKVKCNTCKRYKHPNGTELIEYSRTLDSFFDNWYKNDK